MTGSRRVREEGQEACRERGVYETRGKRRGGKEACKRRGSGSEEPMRLRAGLHATSTCTQVECLVLQQEHDGSRTHPPPAYPANCVGIVAALQQRVGTRHLHLPTPSHAVSSCLLCQEEVWRFDSSSD